MSTAIPTIAHKRSAAFQQSREHADSLNQRFSQFHVAKFQQQNMDSSLEGSVAKLMETLPADEVALCQKFAANRVNTTFDAGSGGEMLSGDYAYKAQWAEDLSEQELNRLGKGVTRAQHETTRYKLAKGLIKNRAVNIHGNPSWDGNLMKAGVPGVTTALGINFYDLRPPVELLYPVNVPFRNSLARISRVNDGWGTAAHWMATRNVGSSPVEAEEGKRVAYSLPDNNQYVATYKELGVERAVSFTAQAAGEGFADNVADEHIRALHSLFLGEEGLNIAGNSGTGSGNNGYALGTAPTPTLTQAAGSTAFTTANTIYVYLVCIAPLGIPNNNWYGYLSAPTLASGLTPVFNRGNADGSSTTLNGGTSQISAAGSVAITTNGNQVTATAVPAGSTIPGVQGAAGYAWFVGTAAGTANALLYSITTVPSVTITAVGTGEAANSANLNADHSYNTLDYDGLLTWSQSGGGYFVSQWGQGPSSSNSLTPLKMGGVTEIENALEYFWSTFQAVPSAIWCGFQARLTLDYAMKWGGTNGQVATIFLNPNQVGGLVGGFQFDSYLSKWGTPSGNDQRLPIMHHPMLPSGTIFFDITDNPYPHSRLPYTRGMLVQRDYYSIEWPITTREWTFGTYAHQTLQHHVPWLSGQITNIGAFVGN
jgi:hypothetical protein